MGGCGCVNRETSSAPMANDRHRSGDCDGVLHCCKKLPRTSTTALDRQWPEVSDFVARFCTLCESNNTRSCENFACDSRMAVCCLTHATLKNV